MTLTPLQENGATRSGADCFDAELLASYVDGRANPEERVKVEAHIAHCEDCYFIFSETVREQRAHSAAGPTALEPLPGARRWMSRVAVFTTAGLAAAAALVIAAQIYLPGYRERPKVTLQVALSELDAAAGPYRKVEPRLTITPTHRQLEPALRSAAPSAEASIALREAAQRVETAARARGTGVEGQRALAAMYFALGRAQPAADVLETEEQSNDAGVLSDVAAAYLARQAEGDVQHALDLLERAVTLDPKRAEAWFNLGLAARAARQTARAQEAWKQYLVLDPSSEWANEARWHLEKLQK